MTEYMGCYRDNGDTRALEHGAWGNDDIERVGERGGVGAGVKCGVRGL